MIGEAIVSGRRHTGLALRRLAFGTVGEVAYSIAQVVDATVAPDLLLFQGCLPSFCYHARIIRSDWSRGALHGPGGVASLLQGTM